MLMARPKDVRLITIYGYTRLIRYDENFNIVPDILECLEVENGRFLTLHIRQRHRWSDGQPFTSEEFRYYWEDLANNTELSPVGPPKVFRVGNELPNFESSTIRRFASLGPTQIGIFCNRSRIACRFTFTGYRIICGSFILDTTTKRPLRPRRKKTACRVEPAFITGIKLHVNSSHRDVLRNLI